MNEEDVEIYLRKNVLKTASDIERAQELGYIEVQFDDAIESAISENVPNPVIENITLVERAIAHIAGKSKVGKSIEVNLIGFDKQTIKINELKAGQVGKLVKVHAMVNGFMGIKPIFDELNLTCKNCGTNHIKKQTDPFKIDKPVACRADLGDEKYCSCSQFQINLEQCTYQDSQKVKIQELPDDATTQIPQLIDLIILKKSLLNKVKCGDLITVIGIVKVKVKDTGDTRFTDPYIEPNNIIVKRKELDASSITPVDIEAIETLAKEPNIYKRLISNFAPSLVLMDNEKEAALLAMVGGVEEPSIDAKRRHWIHVLYAGDPAAGKSQLLKTAAQLAPIGMFVGGRGISAAGLTAAVIKEDDSWMLIAGAMPLCDRGICCVDEIDKMRPEDRETMHIGMEQGIVPINKANINTTLMSRASVLAAANPVMSKWNDAQSIAENIKNLPIPLQTRFDLIFIVRDTVDADRDRIIAERILNETSEASAAIDRNTLRNYLIYAKTKAPKMQPSARKAIKEFYLTARRESTGDGLPVTPRQLEALKRLAEAHAKLLLKDTVDAEDAEAGIRLLKISLRQTTKGAKADDEDGVEGMIKAQAIKSDGKAVNQAGKEFMIRKLFSERKVLTLQEVVEITKYPEQEVQAIIGKLYNSGAIYTPWVDEPEKYRVGMGL